MPIKTYRDTDNQKGHGSKANHIVISNKSTNRDILTLHTESDGSASGPLMSFVRDSNSPANSDTLGKLQFKGKNDNGDMIRYGQIRFRCGPRRAWFHHTSEAELPLSRMQRCTSAAERLQGRIGTLLPHLRLLVLDQRREKLLRETRRGTPRPRLVVLRRVLRVALGRLERQNHEDHERAAERTSNDIAAAKEEAAAAAAVLGKRCAALEERCAASERANAELRAALVEETRNREAAVDALQVLATRRFEETEQKIALLDSQTKSEVRTLSANAQNKGRYISVVHSAQPIDCPTLES